MAKKILVVDDELPILELISANLCEHGYEVLRASDGYTAMQRAVNGNPDLIIMDVKMPAGGGMSAYDNLRHSARTSMTPIIFITAYANHDLLKKIEQDAAVDYLAKPFKMGDLLIKIRQMLKEEA